MGPGLLTVFRIWEIFSDPGNEVPQESIGAFLKRSSAEGRKPTHFSDIADNSGFSRGKLPKKPKLGLFSDVAVLAGNEWEDGDDLTSKKASKMLLK